MDIIYWTSILWDSHGQSCLLVSHICLHAFPLHVAFDFNLMLLCFLLFPRRREKKHGLPIICVLTVFKHMLPCILRAKTSVQHMCHRQFLEEKWMPPPPNASLYQPSSKLNWGQFTISPWILVMDVHLIVCTLLNHQYLTFFCSTQPWTLNLYWVLV